MKTTKNISAALPPERAAFMQQLVKKQEKYEHYRANSLDWMVDRLGVRRETIDWSRLPAYKKHKWDGTPNPLMHVLHNMEQGVWTAVESATGVGKTYLGACIVLWFLDCWRNSRIGTIAPKQEQLSLHIWSEISQLHPRFGHGELQSLRLKMEPPKDYWAALGFVAGVSKEETSLSAARAQGWHRKDMLIIFEETPGVAEEVLTAFENTAGAPHNILLAFGNPNNQLDTLHQFANRERVDLVRISALDHPNVVLKDPEFIPGAQSEIGLQTLLSKYGNDESSQMYRSRAMGECPSQATDSLIRWEWCVAATKKEGVRGIGALGVDVANSDDGDEAAIARGSGSVLVSVESFPCPNALALGTQVYELMTINEIPPSLTGIDGIGVGVATVNKVNELLDGKGKVKDIQSGSTAEERPGIQMKEQFDNLRSQMWWQLRVDLQSGNIELPYDHSLFVELTTVKFEEKKNKVVVESKAGLKKRLGRSPDKADAVVYWNWVRERRQSVGALASTDSGEKEEKQVERRTHRESEAYASERRSRLWR